MIKEEYDIYFSSLQKVLKSTVYAANEAKAKKKDPMDKIEVHFCHNIFDKIEKIIGFEGLSSELEFAYKKTNKWFIIALIIARNIVTKKIKSLHNLNENQTLTLALQTTLVILSRGLITIPTESIPNVEINRRTRHLTVYFSNTIRYAPGEVIGLVILIADYLRKKLYLKKFHMTEDVYGRYLEEILLFLGENNTQLTLNLELIKNTIGNIGIEISGESYTNKEVVNYRNLPNIPNLIRPGMCVAIQRFLERLSEVSRIRKDSGIPDWSWIDTINPKDIIKHKMEFSPSSCKINQPLIAPTNTNSGFRLRYGRARNIGLGTVGINPATIFLLKIASPGTQIMLDSINRPLTISQVSTIQGPLVELISGEIRRINTIKEAKSILNQVSAIIDLGDVLLNPEDVAYAEKMEVNSWTEDLWLNKINGNLTQSNLSLKVFAEENSLDFNQLSRIIENPNRYIPSFDLALNISNILNISLHPAYIANWDLISFKEFVGLIEQIEITNNSFIKKKKEIQGILKKLQFPFTFKDNNIQLDLHHDLLVYIIKHKSEILAEKTDNNLERILKKFLPTPTFANIPRRLGMKIIKPEKNSTKKTSPSSHCLFPVGFFGGSKRDLIKAAKSSDLKLQLPYYYCPECKIEIFVPFCPQCKKPAKQQYRCSNNHLCELKQECDICGSYSRAYGSQNIDLDSIIKSSLKRMKIETIKKIKGVSYLKNETKIPENISKGILRSINDLYVFKDGTTRFDVTNEPLTHFKPKEFNISLKLLSELGYTHDINGKNIESTNQIIELFPFDIIIDKNCKDFLIKLSKFLDDELTLLYKENVFFGSSNNKQNILGSLIVGINPTSQIGTIGRIIGFSNTNITYANPIWYLLKGRNCNGDVDSLTFLLDILLNYSQAYLPPIRGGIMDTSHIIQIPRKLDELNELTRVDYIPICTDFYSRLNKRPKKDELFHVNTPINEINYSYTHQIESLNDNFNNLLNGKSSIEKIEPYLSLIKKIPEIDEEEILNAILKNNYLKKMTNSLKKYFVQPFKCRRCQTNFRRIPLSNQCPSCNGTDSIVITRQATFSLRLFNSIKLIEKRYGKLISTTNQSWINNLELNKNNLFNPEHQKKLFS